MLLGGGEKAWFVFCASLILYGPTGKKVVMPEDSRTFNMQDRELKKFREHLLKEKHKKTPADKDLINLLQRAITKGQFECAECLLGLYSKVEALKETLRAKLTASVASGDKDKLASLLSLDKFEGITFFTPEFLGQQLHSALIPDNRTELITTLLKSGANMTAQDEQGNTPLHLAIKCYLTYTELENPPEDLLDSALEAIKILSRQSDAVSQATKNNDGLTPIELAAESGNLMLFEHFKPGEPYDSFYDHVCWTSERGYSKWVEAIINRENQTHQEPSAPLSINGQDLNEDDKSDNTTKSSASSLYSITSSETAQLQSYSPPYHAPNATLVPRNPNEFSQQEILDRALLYAANADKSETVDVLLKLGANPFVRLYPYPATYPPAAEPWKSAYQLAFNNEKTASAKIIFEHYYKQGTILSKTIVLSDFENLNSEGIALLAKVEAENKVEHPLFEALRENNADKIEQYIRIIREKVNTLKAPSNLFVLHEVMDTDHYSPQALEMLMLACKKYNVPLDLEVQDATGGTPLIRAVHYKNLEKSKLLVRHGAKLIINERNLYDLSLHPYRSLHKVAPNQVTPEQLIPNPELSDYIYRKLMDFGYPPTPGQNLADGTQQSTQHINNQRNHPDIGIIRAIKQRDVSIAEELLSDPRTNKDNIEAALLFAFDEAEKAAELKESSDAPQASIIADELQAYIQIIRLLFENKYTPHDNLAILHWAAQYNYPKTIEAFLSPRASIYDEAIPVGQVVGTVPPNVGIGQQAVFDQFQAKNSFDDGSTSPSSYSGKSSPITASVLSVSGLTDPLSQTDGSQYPSQFPQSQTVFLDSELSGKTALMIALKHNQPDVVRVLLEQGASPPLDVNGKIKEKIFIENTPRSRWSTPQPSFENMDACYALYKFLREKGRPFNPSGSTNSKGQKFEGLLTENDPYKFIENKLIEAAKKGSYEDLMLALDEGCNVQGLSRKNANALQLAAINSNNTTELIEELIERGIDVNDYHAGTSSPLECAAKGGNTENIQALLNHGARLVSERDGRDSSAYNVALQKGNIPAANLLFREMRLRGLEIKYEPSLRPAHQQIAGILKDVETELNAIIKETNRDLNTADIKEYGKKGGELNGSGVNGNTALITAVIHNKAASLACLLEKKDINLLCQNNDGKTALDIAIEDDRQALCKQLIDKLYAIEPQLEEVKDYCYQIAYKAIEHGNLEVLKYALEKYEEKHGDIATYKESEEKNQLLNKAVKLGDLEITKYLHEERGFVLTVDIAKKSRSDENSKLPWGAIIAAAESANKPENNDKIDKYSNLIKYLYLKTRKPVKLSIRIKDELVTRINSAKEHYAETLIAMVTEGNLDKLKNVIQTGHPDQTRVPEATELRYFSVHPDETNKQGQTAVMTLANLDEPNDDMCQYLLPLSKKLAKKSKDGKTALMMAIEKNNQSSHTTFIESYFANRSENEIVEILSVKDSNGKDALMLAVEKGNLGVVNILLSQSYYSKTSNLCDLDLGVSSLDNNLIHSAFSTNNLEIIKAIYCKINGGDDIKSKKDFRTLFCYTAIKKGNHEFIRWVAESDPNFDFIELSNIAVNKRILLSGANFLSHAANNGNTEIVQSILKKSPSLVDMKDTKQRQSIHWASASGYGQEHKPKERFKEIIKALYIKMAKPVKSAGEHESNTDNTNRLLIEVKKEYGNQLRDLISSHHDDNDKTDEITGLLASGVFVDEADENGHTPLFHAIEHDKTKLIGLLLEHKANIEQTFINNKTPLQQAMEKGCNLETLKALYNKTKETHENRSTFLAKTGTEAIKLGLVEFFQFLYEEERFQPSSVPQELKSNTTLLSLAVKHAQEDMVSYLLTNRDFGSPDVRDSQGKRPIEWASFHSDKPLSNKGQGDYFEVACRLYLAMKKPATVSNSVFDSDYALLKSVKKHYGKRLCDLVKDACKSPKILEENKEEINKLIKSGVSISELDHQGCSALYYATIHEHGDMIEFLSKQGADINEYIKDPDSSDEGSTTTPLFVLTKRQSIASVKKLLELGATVDEAITTTKSSSHPFLNAIESNNPELIEVFLDKGIDISRNYKSSSSYSSPPLVHAIKMKKIQSIETLLKEFKSRDPKPDINAKNDQGESALYHATINQNENLVKRLLLEFGADPNYSGSGLTPIAAATKNNWSRGFQWLLYRGALLFKRNGTSYSAAECINNSERQIQEIFALNILKNPSNHSLPWQIQLIRHDIIIFRNHCIEALLKGKKFDELSENQVDSQLTDKTRFHIYNHLKLAIQESKTQEKIVELLANPELTENYIYQKVRGLIPHTNTPTPDDGFGTNTLPSDTVSPLPSIASTDKQRLYQAETPNPDLKASLIAHLKSKHQLDDRKIATFWRKGMTRHRLFDQCVPQTVFETHRILKRFENYGTYEGLVAALKNIHTRSERRNRQREGKILELLDDLKSPENVVSAKAVVVGSSSHQLGSNGE